ncbi:MAG: hypothetical protein GY720_04470 [bacterium]|nr:hypothetical protein [bacterium]
MARSRYLAAAVVVLLVLGACTPSSSPPDDTTQVPTTTAAPTTTMTTTTERPEPTLDPAGSYAVVAFANHLPVFGTNGDGEADRPWARLHTARDYVTMTRLIAESNAKIVLSYSPVLLDQIGDVASGIWDQAAAITAKPVTELTSEDKAYIDDVFFRASPAQIDRFPRYRELVNRRTQGRNLSPSEYRDIQVLFNLAWTSPLLLEEEPLLSIAAKGRNFAEADKLVVLDAHIAAAEEFLTALDDLSTAGKIDVATTPLANPTLPFLIRNRMDRDAADHIKMGAGLAADVLGQAPTGLLPDRGLIDQANGSSLLAAGYRWVLVSGGDPINPIRLSSEEGTLLALTIDSDDVGRRIADHYFGLDPNAAALDLVRKLTSTVGSIPGGVATIVADGTEPWGRYEDGGVNFLRSLLRQLAGATEFSTELPSVLSASLDFEPGQYPELPSSYLSESDELAAWAFLSETRRQYLREVEVGAVDSAALDHAYEQILHSQDSDWYWWYGEERASGEDAYYDDLFRRKLIDAWEVLGERPPSWANVPLNDSPAVVPTRRSSPPATITIDNSIGESEWARAGYYEDRSSDLVRRVFYTSDEESVYMRVDFTSEVLGDSAPGFDLYLTSGSANGSALTPLENPIGFKATQLATWRGTNPVRISAPRPYPGGSNPSDEILVAGFDGTSIEFEFSLESLGEGLRPGDSIAFRIVDVTGGPEGSAFPAEGRGSIELPNLELGIELASISDRLRDDHGPGSYSYITDSEIRDGTYDLAGLAVRQVGGPTEADPDSESEVQFEITFREPLNNPWSAPAGFSHQTVDLYLEAYPGTATGARRLLPGRTAATTDGVGWDYAFTIDGWEGRHFSADRAGVVTELETPLQYVVLADRQTILVTVPKSALPPGDATIWRYGVAVLANQAIPTLGIHTLRPLSATPGRFRIGGSTGAVNDPMIIDLLHPDAGAQEEALTYPSAVLSGDPEVISVDRLAQLPFLPAA